MSDEVLLYDRREAAKLLKCSERHLWSYTEPRGPIRIVKIGNLVRYTRGELLKFIADQSAEIPPPPQNLPVITLDQVCSLRDMIDIIAKNKALGLPTPVKKTPRLN